MRSLHPAAPSKLTVWVVYVLILTTMVHSQCPNCTTCDLSKNQCSKCNNGFYLTASKTCTACSSTCLSCAGTAITCTNCKPGFVLWGDKCDACTAGCDFCSNSSPGACQACSAGYFDVRGNCEKCTDSNCINCTGRNACEKCKEGYIIKSGACELPTPPPEPTGLSGGTIAGIVIGAVGCLILTVVTIYCLTKNKSAQATAAF